MQADKTIKTVAFIGLSLVAFAIVFVLISYSLQDSFGVKQIIKHRPAVNKDIKPTDEFVSLEELDSMLSPELSSEEMEAKRRAYLSKSHSPEEVEAILEYNKKIEHKRPY